MDGGKSGQLSTTTVGSAIALPLSADMERQILIGLATGIGSLLVMAGLVFTILALCKRSRKKEDTSSPDTSASTPAADPDYRQRPFSNAEPPYLPPHHPPDSDSSSTSVAGVKDVGISWDNFSFRKGPNDNDVLAPRLEHELSNESRLQRTSSGTYTSSITPANRHQNFRRHHSESHHVPPDLEYHVDVQQIESGVSQNTSQIRPQNSTRQPVRTMHFGRSISSVEPPQINPSYDNEFVPDIYENHTQITRYNQPRRTLSDMTQSTLPSRMRWDIDNQPFDERRLYRHHNIDDEFTGYFEHSTNESHNHRAHRNIKWTTRQESDDMHSSQQDDWMSNNIYKEFSRLPRIPFAANGNRKFFTEHPQRKVFRPF